MLEAEVALWKAVRDAIQAALSIDDKHCSIGRRDEVPAWISDKYVLVCGGGVSPGPNHASSGGVWDFYINVNVIAYERIGDVPRDRRRSVFESLTSGLSVRLGEIIRTIDFSYPVINAAMTNLTGTSAEGGKFIEPFRTFVPDTDYRSVAFDELAAAESMQQGKMGQPVIALARGIMFQRARFVKGRS